MPPLCLQGFYDQVANPLLVDVELLYPPDTVSALTQHRHKQYYEGSEIMVAGRIADHKLSSFKADVLARGVNGGLWRGGGLAACRGSKSTPMLLPASPHPRLFPQRAVPTLAPCHPLPIPGLNIPACRHPRGGLQWDQNGLICCRPLTKNESPVTPYLVPRQGTRARGQPLLSHLTAFPEHFFAPSFVPQCSACVRVHAEGVAGVSDPDLTAG